MFHSINLSSASDPCRSIPNLILTSPMRVYSFLLASVSSPFCSPPFVSSSNQFHTVSTRLLSAPAQTLSGHITSRSSSGPYLSFPTPVCTSRFQVQSTLLKSESIPVISTPAQLCPNPVLFRSSLFSSCSSPWRLSHSDSDVIPALPYPLRSFRFLSVSTLTALFPVRFLRFFSWSILHRSIPCSEPCSLSPRT